MRPREKYVTWRGLKPGMEITGTKGGKWGTSHFRGIVKSVNAAKVVILKWNTTPEEFDSETTMFNIEIPREELERIYGDRAKALLLALKTPIADYELGEHERDNSWISYDPIEMAAECADRNIRVMGVCRSVPWPHRSGGVEMDIGICAERPDGSRFWCHASSWYLEHVAFGMYENEKQIKKQEENKDVE